MKFEEVLPLIKNGDKIVESQANDSNISFSKEIFNPDTVYLDGLIEGYVNL